SKACKEKGVNIRSAFIRNIVIPDEFLKQKRDRQLAIESEITNKAKEATAQSEADVEKERALVQTAVAKVDSETSKIVAGVERDVQNIEVLTDAEIEKMKFEYGAKIAQLEAERKLVVGEAKNKVTQMTETAKANLFKLKLDVFNNDANAYLKYSMAEQLNP